MKGRLIIVSGLLTFLLFGAWVTAQAQTQSARGGSFFMQFQQDPNNCHGVIKNYDNADAKTQIQTNLHTMQTNGQQKLTVWIGHLREDSSCGVPGANGVNMRSDVMNGQPTCCDYTNYEYQYITNLHNYLSDAQTLYGFNQVVIIMGPELNNWPRNWESYTWGVDNYYYYENWYTVTQVVQAVPPGMPFIIILADEALLPTTSSAPMVQYVHDIWQQYLQTYGTTTGRNQAGFTIGGVRQTAGVKCTDQYGSAVDCETPTNQINDFIAQMNDVGLGLPNYWPLNMFDYDTNDTNRQNANWSGYHEVHNALAPYSAAPIVITSTFENDAATAFGLRAAANDVLRPISFLMQWPLVVAAGFNTWDYLVQNFSNYIAYGF